MDKKFFCIRGYMKSGTNWLGRIFKSHHQIDCVGEFHWESFFSALDINAHRIAPKRKEHYLQTVRPNLELMIKRSLSQFSSPDAHWIGDRTPTTISPISIHDAPHIVIVRDIRDVLVSRMFHLFNHPRVTTIFDQYPQMKIRLEKFQQDPWYFKRHPGELLDHQEIVRTSAKEWAAFIDCDEDTIAAHPDLSVMRIRYEDLHREFTNTANSLFEFIGASAPTTLPDVVQPGHPKESPNELNRKGVVGDWENYMDERCVEWIVDEAGAQMTKLGYEH